MKIDAHQKQKVYKDQGRKRKGGKRGNCPIPPPLFGRIEGGASGAAALHYYLPPQV